MQFAVHDRALLGALLAVFLASSQSQAVQVTGPDNFSYIISAAVWSVALLCPFVFGHPLRAASIGGLLLLLACVIVFFGNVRTTALAIAAAVPFVLLFYRAVDLPRRVLLAAGFFLLIMGAQAGVRTYFDCKFAQATEVVTKAGGVPYQVDRIDLHPFWHPVWCGLGDFDEKYGYEWSDGKARRVAIKEMKRRGMEVPRRAPSEVGRYFYVEITPQYAEVVRSMILEDIHRDPVWYLEILGKRIQKIFTEWEDPSLDLGFTRLRLWHSWWVYLGFLVLLGALGMWGEVRLVVMTLPTILVAVFVTTITRTHYYLIAHLVCAALIATCLMNVLAYVVSQRRPLSRK